MKLLFISSLCLVIGNLMGYGHATTEDYEFKEILTGLIVICYIVFIVSTIYMIALGFKS